MLVWKAWQEVNISPDSVNHNSIPRLHQTAESACFLKLRRYIPPRRVASPWWRLPMGNPQYNITPCWCLPSVGIGLIRAADALKTVFKPAAGR